MRRTSDFIEVPIRTSSSSVSMSCTARLFSVMAQFDVLKDRVTMSKISTIV